MQVFYARAVKILRKHGNIDKNNLPFWTVFQGDITRDPCRVREITCWYADNTGHFSFGGTQQTLTHYLSISLNI